MIGKALGAGKGCCADCRVSVSPTSAGRRHNLCARRNGPNLRAFPPKPPPCRGVSAGIEGRMRPCGPTGPTRRRSRPGAHAMAFGPCRRAPRRWPPLGAEAEAGRAAYHDRPALRRIKYAHKLARLPDPTEDEAVRATMKGIRRKVGTAPDQKAAATADNRHSDAHADPRYPHGQAG